MSRPCSHSETRFARVPVAGRPDNIVCECTGCGAVVTVERGYARGFWMARTHPALAGCDLATLPLAAYLGARADAAASSLSLFD